MTWIKEFDDELVKADRRILLHADNFSGHCRDSPLRTIQLRYFFPNTTSLLQPLDQGTIASFKSSYGQKVCDLLIEIIENKPCNGLYQKGVLKLGSRSQQKQSKTASRKLDFEPNDGSVLIKKSQLFFRVSASFYRWRLSRGAKFENNDCNDDHVEAIVSGINGASV